MDLGKFLPLLCAAVLSLAVGCGGKTATTPSTPGETVARWWRAVAAGDAAAVGDCLAGEPGSGKSAKVFAEYALVKKAAGAGDPLARRMLEKLEGVRLDGVRGGSLLSVAQLVFADGKPFFTLYLEPRDGRWLIVDLK